MSSTLAKVTFPLSSARVYFFNKVATFSSPKRRKIYDCHLLECIIYA